MKFISHSSTGAEKIENHDLIMQFDDEIRLEDLSEDDFKKVAKNYYLQNLTSAFENEIKKRRLDIQSLKKTWLLSLNSNVTRLNYKHNLEEFLELLSNKNIMEIRSIDVERYLIYLKGKNYSAGTIRFKAASASSFISFLVRHDYMSVNYFQKIKLPPRKIEIKLHEDVPNAGELYCIEQELLAGLQAAGQGSSGKIKASKMLLAVLYVMMDTACRVGALPSIRLDPTGNFSAKSKGSFIRGKISPDLIEKIKELGFDESAPFKDFKTATIKKYFEIVLKRLYQQGNIRKVFSPHSIRHYAAVKHWKQNHDIYALKKFLNHQSISTSQVYLASLNLDIGDIK